MIATVQEHTLARNERICEYLDERIDVFMPQTITPSGDHRRFPRHVWERCVYEIGRSDMGLMVVPHGVDCGWEAGRYSVLNKPVVAYIEKEIEWLEHWMVKGAPDIFSVTPEQGTFEALREDEALSDKSFLLASPDQLSDRLVEIHERCRHG